MVSPSEGHPASLTSHVQRTPAREPGRWLHVADHPPLYFIPADAVLGLTWLQPHASEMGRGRGEAVRISWLEKAQILGEEGGRGWWAKGNSFGCSFVPSTRSVGGSVWQAMGSLETCCGQGV